MSNVPPLSRTNAEARLFVDLKPCARCGERGATFRSSVIRSDGMLIGRYRGTCNHCQNPFEYDFRLPEQPLPPPTDGVLFGGAEPSVLLDPAIWLRYSDICVNQVPMDSGGLDEQGRRAARHTLMTAIAAVDEVLKFIPPQADRVPESEFWSSGGRMIYQEEPGRFDRFRLEAVREAYADTLARW